jgi:hypothetical protein
VNDLNPYHVLKPDHHAASGCIWGQHHRARAVEEIGTCQQESCQEMKKKSEMLPLEWMKGQNAIALFEILRYTTNIGGKERKN